MSASTSERRQAAEQRARELSLGLALSEEESRWGAERNARRLEAVTARGEVRREGGRVALPPLSPKSELHAFPLPPLSSAALVRR